MSKTIRNKYFSISEISRLYSSRVLTAIAGSITSGFSTVYLYKQGYTLFQIIFIEMVFCIIMILSCFVSVFLISRFGPKHTVLYSNIIQIPAMVLLSFVPNLGMLGIMFWIILIGIASPLYSISQGVVFSKIKNDNTVGRQIAILGILERVAIGAGPIIGGLIALFFGPKVIMLASAGIYLIAAMPLLRTAEPTTVRLKTNFIGLPWATAIHGIIAQSGIGFGNVSSGIAWSMFIVITIFPITGNSIYLTLGALSSLAFVVAVVATYIFGKIIDKKNGGKLLKYCTVIWGLAHLSRPFIKTPSAVVGVNIVNEMASTGVAMTNTRGVVDIADKSGHRIEYTSLINAFSCIGGTLACICLLITITLIGDINGLKLFFIIAAPFSFIAGTSKFRVYNKLIP